MPSYQRGEASIYYEEYGSGFPLLLIAPGGMNSAITFWSRMPFNPIEALRDEFRVIAMDQRNCGQSTGPLDPDDPWGSYVDDQLGLLDYLDIDRYMSLGSCIGCSYIVKQLERQPNRMQAGVLMQPIGLVESNREVFQDRIWKPWGEGLVSKRADLSTEGMLAFGQRMWGGDFVFSVSHDFLKTIETPLLVLPGYDQAHPTEVGLEVASLLPNSEVLEGWKANPDVVPHTIEVVREFLKKHVSGAAS
ncbi:MAG: alpha/beta hydrolase [Dehalococcoidia bacterium]|nr:alpha/beta hydrolase [Dehalococcoidia bacterium]